MSKSQISVDFIIVLSISLIMFLAIFTIIDKRNDVLESYRTQLYAKQLADKLSSEINSIFIAGHGTNKTIFLPETLKDKTPYNITVYPFSHIINIDYNFEGIKRHYETTTITANVSGNLSGINNTIKLINFNGGIIIEK